MRIKREVQYLVGLEGCPRCSEDHESVLFQRLSGPEDERDLWGMCPTNNQPILASAAEIGSERFSEGVIR